MNRILSAVIGTAVMVWSRASAPARAARRDQRGLSQSTESALLVGGAVVIAGLVVLAVRAFVEARLP